MLQINRPTGLIAYDTDINAERRIAGKPPVYRLIRARTVLYAVIIAVVGGIMLYTLATRSSLGISALHERSPLFVTLSDGSVRNDYTVRFLNKAGCPAPSRWRVLGLPAAEVRTSGIERAADGKLIVEVGPDQTREVRVSVQVPAAKLPKEATDIEFRATDIATGQTASVRDHFVAGGPLIYDPVCTSAARRPDQRERHLDDAACEPQRDADPPRHGVGAERVVHQPAAISAEEAADLVAHEGEALDHRLPFQTEHFGDRAGNQRAHAHPEEAHDRPEQQRGRRRRRQHEVPGERERARGCRSSRAARACSNAGRPSRRTGCRAR